MAAGVWMVLILTVEPRMTFLRPVWLMGALMLTGSAVAQSGADRWAPAPWERNHDPTLVEVRLIDRSTQRPVLERWFEGRRYAAGERGVPYAIELYHPGPGRVLAVVSVDGVNVVSGETASPDQTGYVLGPGQRVSITGWRKSWDRVARFEFASVGRSYAAQTGRAHQVGVIGVAAFEERRPMPMWRDDRAEDRASEAGASRSKSMEEARPAAAPSLGTAHGPSEGSVVQGTTFVRASSRPSEVVTIEYDTLSNLRRRGVWPQERWDRQERDPFPGRFVPDPTR